MLLLLSIIIDNSAAYSQEMNRGIFTARVTRNSESKKVDS
jgi:hypothetical protein